MTSLSKKIVGIALRTKSDDWKLDQFHRTESVSAVRMRLQLPIPISERQPLQMATDAQKHSHENVIQRLEALQYSRSVIERLKDLHSGADSSEITVIDIRIALEKFLEETARLSTRYGGPRFAGDFSRPALVRSFLQNGCWITEAEFEFISAFYGLISDRYCHGGDSMMDPQAARYLFWSVVDTISHRVLNRPRPSGFAREEDKIEQALANEFVEALRAGRFEGRAFEPTFSESTMKRVRQRLTNNDTNFLWSLMDNPSALPELRNRCASLLLGERLSEHPEEQGRVAEAMRQYFSDNEEAPWQLRRAIALALCNQTGDTEHLKSYLSAIQKSSDLLELNLRTTETYYRSAENALSKCLRRINDRRLPTAKCIWELFYVSRRATLQKDKALRAIERRARDTEDPELRDFCSQCLVTLRTIT